MLPEIIVQESTRQETKSNQQRQQRQHNWVGETECRCALTFDLDGLSDTVECVFACRAIVTDSLGVQKPSVGLEADLPQLRKVLQSFADGEVARVVDGCLRPKCAPFFVVLLDLGVFVINVQ